MEMFDQRAAAVKARRAKQLQKQKGCARMNKFDMMSKDALSKMEELMNASKLNELLHKKEEEDKKKTCIPLDSLRSSVAVAAVADRVCGLSFLHPIIWKTLRTISTMISMDDFSRMRRKPEESGKSSREKKMRTRRQRLKSSRTAGWREKSCSHDRKEAVAGSTLARPLCFNRNFLLNKKALRA